MNSSKSWDLEIDPDVFKTLRKIPGRDAKRISEVIKLLPLDPHFGDIQKMKGEEQVWRRRIGEYRLSISSKAKKK